MTVRGLPKLVATDLDGTLVRSDGLVSGYATAVLGRVRSSGISVVGVTGRGPRLIEITRRDAAAADYLVLAQGGTVLDLSGPSGHAEVLHAARIDGAAVAEAVRLLETAVGPVHVLVEALDGPGAPLWGDAGAEWPYPEAWERRAREELLRGELLKAFVRAPALDSDELLAVARRVVPETLCWVTHAGLRYIEIVPPGVTKATGLAVVASALGVDRGDVLVFGDMPNDVPMFEWAGYGVAVANSHTELLAVADEVTGSNDDDGVAGYLDGMLERGHI